MRRWGRTEEATVEVDAFDLKGENVRESSAEGHRSPRLPLCAAFGDATSRCPPEEAEAEGTAADERGPILNEREREPESGDAPSNESPKGSSEEVTESGKEGSGGCGAEASVRWRGVLKQSPRLRLPSSLLLPPSVP